MAGKQKEIDTGKLGEAPNDKWAKFFEKSKEFDSIETSKWKVDQLIGYFAHKYYLAYNKKYSFKFNNPSPNKSFEVFQIKKLALQLSASPVILRDYIDWAFQEKIEKQKRKLTSISFMTHEDMVNYYKINILLSNKKELHVDRSTELPSDYKRLLQEIGPIQTYGDLAFMAQSFKSNAFDAEMTAKFETIKENLESKGLDFSILDRIV